MAQAVEGGVAVDLLVELQAEIQAALEVPPEEGEAVAIWQVADLVGISKERAAKTLAAIEAGSTEARQRLLRGIAETRLKGHQETYRRPCQGR